MRAASAFVFLALGALLFASGCSGKAGTNDDCVADGDCKRGSICRDEICVVPCTASDMCPGSMVCAAGMCSAPCTSDSMCPMGRICVEGGCVPRPRTDGSVDGRTDGGQDGPMTDADGNRGCNGLMCAMGEVCLVDACVSTCDADRDCDSDEKCKGGVCRPGCDEDGDCEAGALCVTGVCRERCSARAPCVTGICFSTTEDAPGDGVCLPGCGDATTICDDGEICFEGVCQADPCEDVREIDPTFCTQGRDTPDDPSDDGICLPRCLRQNDACFGVECEDDQTCFNGACVSGCFPRPPCSGVFCPDGEHCNMTSGSCESNLETDSLCPPGYVSDPVCQIPDPCIRQCESDSDCGDRQICNVRDGVGQCQCEDSGERCLSGECVPDLCAEANCTGSETCLDGDCVETCCAMDCGPGAECVLGSCVPIMERCPPASRAECGELAGPSGMTCPGRCAAGSSCMMTSPGHYECTACIPDCTELDALGMRVPKACGAPNGCGGECMGTPQCNGECRMVSTGDYECVCTQDCSSVTECGGLDPLCGRPCDVDGACTGPQQTCAGTGGGYACACEPDCTGANCGDGDGCGGNCTGSCAGSTEICVPDSVGGDYECCACDSCGDCGGRCDVEAGCAANENCEDPRSTSGGFMCVCQPSCTGRMCGESNGCGGFCTGCPTGDRCVGTGAAAMCCTPSCTGKSCGMDDGCGRPCVVETGCAANEDCERGSGGAYGCVCQPACSGATCGDDDGCGGDCNGTCATRPGEDGSCNLVSGERVCVYTCRPNCPGGATCGSDNGCGGECAGSCPAMPPNVGSCAHRGGGNYECDYMCVPDCAGKACGASDGCGGTCATGTCSTGYTCSSGVCTPATCGMTCGCGLTCAGGSCVNLCTPGTTLCGCRECCTSAQYCGLGGDGQLHCQSGPG